LVYVTRSELLPPPLRFCSATPTSQVEMIKAEEGAWRSDRRAGHRYSGSR
jgi:hypothetical protein